VTPALSAERLDSLDVFRGMTVAAMILVSTPGSWEAVYPPLDHAAWNGWTPTDLVFPFFLFAMGAAVPFALERRRLAARPVRVHVVRRGLVLFGIGLLLNAIKAMPPLAWSTFRIPGVLQRIALVYVAVALLTEHTSRRTQAIVAAAALAGYWAVMMLVPVPGVGAGVLTPDGNLASYIDRRLLPGHLAFGAWDPEGLLSTVPSIATALVGVFAGAWLLRGGSQPDGSLSLCVAGAAASVAGLVWGRVFPINKNLWTSSFALFTAGMAAQLMAVFHWLLDVRRWRGWELPFVAFGRNALAAYVLSIGLDSLLTRWTVAPGGASLKWQLYRAAFASWSERCCRPETASLAYAAAYVAVWAVILTVMYRRHIFVGV